MQTLLTDIELDIQELKCVMQAVEQGGNPALREVAKRNIRQMQARLEDLARQLDEVDAESASGAEAVQNDTLPLSPVAHKEPVASDVEEVVAVSPASEPVLQDGIGEPLSEEPLPSLAEEGVPSAQATPILGERIRPATDLRHAISLNDAFRFARELFKGDGTRMNEVLEQLGNAATLDEALRIFYSTVPSEEENEAAADFIELLKKYFS